MATDEEAKAAVQRSLAAKEAHRQLKPEDHLESLQGAAKQEAILSELSFSSIITSSPSR